MTSVFIVERRYCGYMKDPTLGKSHTNAKPVTSALVKQEICEYMYMKDYILVRSLLSKNCYKCFSGSQILRVHERSHTGEKPYQCKTCNKCFSQAGHLKRHERSYTGEKICWICQEKLSSCSLLVKHYEGHMK